MEDKKSIFEKLYEKEVDRVFRFVLIRVSSKDEAVDITEESFYKLWQSMQDGKHIENHLAFLFAITRNKIIDWYRKKKSYSLESLLENKDDVDGEALQVGDPDAHTNITTSVEANWVIKTLSQLDKRDAEILELRFIQGLQPQEISEILGTSANSISIRINRAVAKLRKELGINLEENE